MTMYLVHYESPNGAHLWQKVEAFAPPDRNDALLAVFLVPQEMLDWPEHELAPIAHTLEKAGRTHV